MCSVGSIVVLYIRNAVKYHALLERNVPYSYSYNTVLVREHLQTEFGTLNITMMLNGWGWSRP